VVGQAEGDVEQSIVDVEITGGQAYSQRGGTAVFLAENGETAAAHSRARFHLDGDYRAAMLNEKVHFMRGVELRPVPGGRIDLGE
jgi:hypothetical protein